MRPITVAIVGSNGMVGREALAILDESRLNIQELRLFATERSAGQNLAFRKNEIQIKDLAAEKMPFKGVDVALFCADGAVAREFAPQALSQGCWVVDNSSAYRMDPNTALICPVVNGGLVAPLKKRGGAHIIANPNCSTLQLVVPLKCLQDKFGIDDVIVSSYQAVSGAGRDGLDALARQTNQILDAYDSTTEKGNFHRGYGERVTAPSAPFPKKIGFNLIPQIGNFDSDGFCEEEQKIMRETRKILNLPKLSINATTVRAPVFNVHSESVAVTLARDASKAEVEKAFQSSSALEYLALNSEKLYPTPAEYSGRDPIGVGRLRQDLSNPRRFHFWVVADNLRVGAALNAIQILELIVS